MTTAAAYFRPPAAVKHGAASSSAPRPSNDVEHRGLTSRTLQLCLMPTRSNSACETGSHSLVCAQAGGLGRTIAKEVLEPAAWIHQISLGLLNGGRPSVRRGGARSAGVHIAT